MNQKRSKKERQHWTNDLIKERVLEVIQALELDRMPSRAECEHYYGNSALTSAISKTAGGWYTLAEDLQLPVKRSETGLGKYFEKIAQDKLTTMGFDVLQMPQNFPYDILANQSVKIDVKVSNLYRGVAGNFYTFNTEKPYATCDIYMLFAIDSDRQIRKELIVPSVVVMDRKQISVGEHHSKYDVFAMKYDYISKYSVFHQSIQR